MVCKSKGSPSKLRDVPFEHSHVLPCAMRELRRYSTSTTPMVLNGGPVPARSCASEERGASAQVRVHVKLKRGDTVRRRSCLLAAELLDIASGTFTPATSEVSPFQIIPSMVGFREWPPLKSIFRGATRGKSARSQPMFVHSLSVRKCRLVPQRGWWRWCSCWCPVKECASSPRNSLPLA